MSKIDTYRQALRSIDDWEPYLLAESGLPGPRGNIELAQAVADEGDEPFFLHLLSFDATSAPTNTPQEFLAFCGVVGLGRLVAEGRRDLLPALRRHANDPRWRMREGVAMALQRWGRVDMPRPARRNGRLEPRQLARAARRGRRVVRTCAAGKPD